VVDKKSIEKRWVSIYQELGAYWEHDNNPLRPHALLTSAKHSNGFFNSSRVLQDPWLCEKAAMDLFGLLQDAGLDIHEPNWVVGPAMGAITLAHDLARVIAKTRHQFCYAGYAEKGEADERGKKTWKFPRIAIERGERVLLIEDVWTTGDSLNGVADLVEAKGGIVLPYRAVLVVRSGETEYHGNKIVALVNRKLPAWEPDECPLCHAGSEAIRPKTPPENWKRLNAVYKK
jgi:orotate phosphoribosyltransferase